VKGGSRIPRIHPLLISLTEAFNESKTAPDISSVCEDDMRAVRSNYYTPPNLLPSLDIDFHGEHGAAQLATHYSWLMLVASENMASGSQEKLPEVGDIK
jgi:hypothetical protein